MKSTFVAMAALLVLVGCAPATAQRPRLSLGTSTKADVLNVNGPPQKREMFEGDEFWYYAERVVNPWESAGHALQNFNAGVHGGAVPPLQAGFAS